MNAAVALLVYLIPPVVVAFGISLLVSVFLVGAEE